MNCVKCNTVNDGDAVFCTNCGYALNAVAEAPRKTWRSYWYALLLVPVLLAAAGMGYYKFMLPNGVAAVVNGEEITMAELDSALRPAGKDVPEEAIGRMRSAALSDLITERIAGQEAHKAGVRVSPEELINAISHMRSAAGMDEKSFDAQVISIYGSRGNFQKGMERRLIIQKFIDEKITAGISDPTIAGFRVNQWLQGISSKAAVRVSLEEQMQSSSGCACCGGGGKGPGVAKHGCDPKAGAQGGGKQSASQITAASDAAISYWSSKHGNGPVETRVTDFGCHIQVDIVANNRIAKSFRYQNGTITEM